MGSFIYIYPNIALFTVECRVFTLLNTGECYLIQLSESDSELWCHSTVQCCMEIYCIELSCIVLYWIQQYFSLFLTELQCISYFTTPALGHPYIVVLLGAVILLDPGFLHGCI